MPVSNRSPPKWNDLKYEHITRKAQVYHETLSFQQENRGRFVNQQPQGLSRRTGRCSEERKSMLRSPGSQRVTQWQVSGCQTASQSHPNPRDVHDEKTPCHVRSLEQFGFRRQPSAGSCCDHRKFYAPQPDSSFHVVKTAAECRRDDTTGGDSQKEKRYGSAQISRSPTAQSLCRAEPSVPTRQTEKCATQVSRGDGTNGSLISERCR